LKDQGQVEAAIVAFRQALKLNPDLQYAQSNLLFVSNYISRDLSSDCLGDAMQFGQFAAKKVSRRFSTWKCTAKPERLRIGMVSGDLMNHPVGYFLEALLAHIDQARIELIAYPTHNKKDRLTARIRPYFLKWESLAGKSDEAAARMIHADGVHILLDLSGHTSNNRLPIFAWKPAPIQVSWLGYFATTGVTEIDYFLADRVGVPEEQQQQFTESIWYLPDTRLCFTVPEFSLPVTHLPALSKRTLTFGCFQNLSKLTEEVLTAWGKIFSALPSARLRMQNKQLA
jgi:predicted O-linked N-acetylglucosamine transferase (SPINDLY family)